MYGCTSKVRAAHPGTFDAYDDEKLSLSASAELSEPSCFYNERIEQLAATSYPQVALLKQIKGVGTLIALTFLLTRKIRINSVRTATWALGNQRAGMWTPFISFSYFFFLSGTWVLKY
jgi:hypothetical protein